MTTTDDILTYRIVKIVETWDGVPARTFYGIYDPQFGHWMSTEPFDGLIWTKDCRCRQQFKSYDVAEMELDDFMTWREEQEAEKDIFDKLPRDREAA